LRESPALRHEITSFFSNRFGVPVNWLDGLAFTEKDHEIWAASAPCPEALHSKRPSGLRIARRAPRGLKPTSVFLATLGTRISSSRIPLDATTLHTVLMGQRVPLENQSDGYVALVYGNDVLGCGQVHAGLLRALIPTGRRRELLALLSKLTQTSI